MEDEIAIVWSPTGRQEQFRNLSELLWFDGTAGVSECMRASRMLASGLDPGKASALLAEAIDQGTFAWDGPPVMGREWRQWEGEEGFLDWWAEAFPEVDGPTKTDLKHADGLFWAAMVQKLAAGEQRAMQMYATIKSAADKADAAADEMGSLDPHFEEPDEVDNGWVDEDDDDDHAVAAK